MIYQIHPDLPKEIHDFGCYFMSVLFLAEEKTSKYIDQDEALAIFRAAKQTGIIGDDCYVKDPVSLFRLAGVRISSVVKASKEIVPGPGGFELLHFHRNADTPDGMKNLAHDHFVAGDGNGNVAFDPMGRSNTVKYGFLENKRIYK